MIHKKSRLKKNWKSDYFILMGNWWQPARSDQAKKKTIIK